MSNYEGKVGHSLGALQVNLTLGAVTRPTLFMVVPSMANFNLRLEREWIHGLGVVPSSMHQRISIWRDDGMVENIEAYQSNFLAEVNQVTRKTFEKNLANIVSCSSIEYGYTDPTYVSSVRLHPTHGFMWEREIPNTESIVIDLIPPTGWNIEDNYYF